jgi:exoribonuclease-2
MSANKIKYPGPGCLVEFMQENGPVQAVVLEEQGGRLRVYAVNRRESTLPPSRLLPWPGPLLGSGLSRQRMDEALEEHRSLRAAIAAGISPLEVWELTQGEVNKATAEWLAGLLWEHPTIDQEAGLGHALLSAKAHFRFSPPDFDIFSQDVVEARLAEAESARVREAFAVTGAQFFQKLWEVYARKRAPLTPQETPEEPLATKLKELIFSRIGDPEGTEDAPIWKLLTKGLPDVPHVALHLAVAWRLVPDHYNFWLDRAGFERGETWAEAFAREGDTLVEHTTAAVPVLERDHTPYVSIDPATTTDRDDACFTEKQENGGFHSNVALACPALTWPFGGDLDKAVQRRGSSLYLPEGDEHMLPARIGRALFSLDAGKLRPAFVLNMHLSPEGEVLEAEPHIRSTVMSVNLDLESAEAALLAGEPGGHAVAVPAKAKKPAVMLQHSLALARLLQARRIAAGAVITERPDPDVQVHESGHEAKVRIENNLDVPLSHLTVGEFMIACNAALADWGHKRGIPLLYRTQDVALPREFAGVWTDPHDISRIVRALPPASLETLPKRHAGLGLPVYATFSSPIRRYTDLVNQGQIVSYLQTGKPRLSQEELNTLLPLLSARSDAVAQVQRQRPRYWKLLFFRQQGDKKWWDAVVADENEAFVTISLPWAQIMVRGKRRQFDEKLFPGMRLQVRLGKVNPLLGEIQVLEAREA